MTDHTGPGADRPVRRELSGGLAANTGPNTLRQVIERAGHRTWIPASVTRTE